MANREELLRLVPEGFLKITAQKPAGQAKLAEGERVALIRKGNELFNLKKYELARKIFLTTGYSDGLIRLGDLYLKQSKPLEAFRMYLLAPDRKKVEAMLEKSVAVLRHWLAADGAAAPKAGAAPAGVAAGKAAPTSLSGSAPPKPQAATAPAGRTPPSPKPPATPPAKG